MVTREEALELARSWATGLWTKDLREVGLHEFALGWVAWPILHAPRDPKQAPPPSGWPTLVIDRETGDMTRWPSIPVSVIAEKYTALKAAGDRFPPDVRMALEDAGWFPGRDIAAAVDQWKVDFADQVAGMMFYPAARAAMREFGGLDIPQAAAPEGGYHSYIFPTGGDVSTDRLEGFLENYEHPVFPLGNHQDDSTELAIDERGRVFFLHWADSFYLGANIDAALVSLIRSGDWPDVFSRTWENDSGEGQPPSVRLNE
jgi:hypothetical protein